MKYMLKMLSFKHAGYEKNRSAQTRSSHTYRVWVELTLQLLGST